jgi:hypothetical protein
VLVRGCDTARCASIPWLDKSIHEAPVGSIRALIEGLIWNIVLGWVIVFVIAPIYNKIAATPAGPTSR